MNDLINSAFELAGSLFLGFNILAIRRDKVLKGASWLPIVVYCLWGYWNLVYYSSLDQWLSFAAGLGVAITNTVYIGHIFYYKRMRRYGKLTNRHVKATYY